MLFLYRPRQTWMPFRHPQSRTDQAAYNRRLQRQFDATRRVPAAAPSSDVVSGQGMLAELQGLAELHASGALTDEEFSAAKERVLGSPAPRR